MFLLLFFGAVLGHTLSLSILPKPGTNSGLHFVVKKNPPVVRVNSNINVSFYDLRLTIPDGWYLFKTATQNSTIDTTTENLVIKGDSISIQLFLNNVQFGLISYGNFKRLETGDTQRTDYNISANGTMYIKKIGVTFSGKLGSDQVVTMKTCNADIGKIDIEEAMDGAFMTQENMQKLVLAGMSSSLSKQVCDKIYAEYRQADVKAKLTDYDKMVLDSQTMIGNDLVSYEERQTDYVIRLLGQAVHMNSSDHPPFVPAIRLMGQPCSPSPNSDMSIAVTRVLFDSILHEGFYHNFSYTTADFKNTKTPMWQHLNELAAEHAKSTEGGELRYTIKLASIPKWTCVSSQCKMSVDTKSFVTYRPLSRQKFVEVFNFNTSFDAEILPRIELNPGYRVRVFGIPFSFNITHNSLEIKTYTQFKSGDNQHFDKDKFQNEMLQTVFNVLMTRGLKLVYPLHKQFGLNGLTLERVDGNGLCISASTIQKNTGLTPTVVIGQK